MNELVLPQETHRIRNGRTKRMRTDFFLSLLMECTAVARAALYSKTLGHWATSPLRCRRYPPGVVSPDHQLNCCRFGRRLADVCAYSTGSREPPGAFRVSLSSLPRAAT